MKISSLVAIATIAVSSAGIAQTDPAAPPVAVAQTTTVHTHTVTHHDGKRHPKVNKVVHRSTVATPNGVATRTTTATSTSTPH